MTKFAPEVYSQVAAQWGAMKMAFYMAVQWCVTPEQVSQFCRSGAAQLAPGEASEPPPQHSPLPRPVISKKRALHASQSCPHGWSTCRRLRLRRGSSTAAAAPKVASARGARHAVRCLRVPLQQLLRRRRRRRGAALLLPVLLPRLEGTLRQRRRLLPQRPGGKRLLVWHREQLRRKGCCWSGHELHQHVSTESAMPAGWRKLQVLHPPG